MSDERIVEAALAGPLAPLAGVVHAALLPSIRLVRDATGASGSWIGGRPRLPEDGVTAGYAPGRLGFRPRLPSARRLRAAPRATGRLRARTSRP